MAENQLASGGASAKAEPPPPPRPTITLPPRSSYESLFRFGGASSGVGGASEVSPGPMTLVSSFFAEDPDSDCRSFSQLLAGAMASPAAIPARGFPAAAEDMTSAPSDSGGGGGGGGGILRSNQPLNLVVMQSPYFTVPPGLSPASLLESPAAGFFAAGSGQFGISHQQALAQVTAQAAQANSHTHNQAEYPFLQASTSAPMTHPASSGMNMTLQQMPLQTSDANNVNSESADASNYDRRSQPMGIIADKPADDGYNWRKYGQKQVKGSEYPRSYYKCTHPSCPVKKKVEHSFDGHVTEIIYKGQHNHQQPPPNKRNNGFSRGNSEPNASLGFHNNSDALGGPQRQSSDGMSVSLISKRDRDSAHGASEQLSESSDGEEVGNADLGPNEGDVNNTDQKRRKTDTKVVESNSSHRVVSEPRIIVQTTSEVDLLDDGYRWRKYGQKVVKGNPHPRSYYKCTSAGCTVRKHVERASTDAKAVVTTYEGKHNHDVPTARNNSHSTASGCAVPNNAHSKPHNTIPNNQHLPKRPDLRNGLQRPIPVRLKEERDAM